jgi:polyphosphate kinase
LRKNGIYLLRRLDLNEQQRDFVEAYFKDHMLPYVQPVLLRSKCHRRPRVAGSPPLAL